MIGKTISNFKVTSELGKGGMGEVWRAQDTKLNRDVALKVLPESFAQDPERLERFNREAQVLASLSHPHIAGIHGLEDVEGTRFLVMEVAEGEDLSDRIDRGPVPVADAARIAIQVAEALEAAHEKGIIHRDLKPGNIKVTEDGNVKVLDFGLAKAMGIHPLSGSSGQDWTQSPTLAPHGTQAGMLLGTAGYMSPEQARGKPVDRRADIWAFGCVLFEMLGGRKAFGGETVTDVLGAIVHKEPEVDKLPADVPRRIRDLIGRCLQKDQSRRLQSIGDARIALQEWLENPQAEAPPESMAAPAAGWRRWLPWTLAGVAGLAGLAAGATLLHREGPDPVRRSLVQVVEPPLQLSIGSAVALSPGGRHLAYVTGSTARTSLRVRPLDRYDTIEIAAGENPDSPYLPFFSPDGEWIGFVTPRELKKAPVTGGTPITLCPLNRSRGATWGPDGQIVAALAPDAGLSLVPASGGQPRPLTTLDESRSERSHRWPQWIPGSRAVLFSTLVETGADWSEASIELIDVDSGERRTLHQGGTQPLYVATGHILFYNRGTVFALPFDVDSLESRGSQFPVLEAVSGRPGNGSADVAISENGLLAYVTGGQGTSPYRIVWVDRNGRQETLWEEPGLYGTPRLSPDGSRLALTVLRDGNLDIWVYDLERRVATRLTFSDGYDADQVWSPDGRFIAFASDRDGTVKIYRKRADGSGQVDLLVECGAEGQRCYPSDWSPDGRVIATTTESGDIWMVPVDGEGTPEAYVASPALEIDPTFSPDGRWVAYQSSESGSGAVYVQSFPLGGGKWQVSDGVGWRPRWTGDGAELVYRTDEGLSVVRLGDSEGTFQPSMAQPLFTGSFLGDLQGVVLGGSVFGDYDIHPDGRRYVMFAGGEGMEVAFVNLVTGWTGELGRLGRADGN